MVSMGDSKEIYESKSASISPSLPKGKKLTQYVAALIVSMLSFNNGLTICWAPTMLPILQSEDSPLVSGPITKEQASWLAALQCLGAFLSGPFYIFVINRFSRKTAGYILAMPFLTSWLFIIFSRTVPLLYIARLIGGMGNGSSLVFIPIYISEMAEDSIRGALGSLLLMTLNSAILFGYVIGAFESYFAYAYIAIVFPLVYLCLFFWLPETPMYLINANETVKAKQSLRWFRGGDEDVVQEEFAKMTYLLKERKTLSQAATFKDILMSPGSRKAFFIGFTLILNQQFCGIYAILSYTVSIFQEAETSLSPHHSSIIVGVLYVLGTILSTPLIDRAGRKCLLLTSNAITAICLIALGVYFYLKSNGSDVSNLGWLPVTSLSIFIFAFAFGLSPGLFIVISEIFEPQIKAKASVLLISVLWLTAFLIIKYFVNISDLLGMHGSFWFFSVCCILGATYIMIAVPETRKRSYASILFELNNGKRREKDNSVVDEAEKL
ncbi:Facilitated trehalose transporter Tret1 [Blattella germanica]|nr:Facilitated trehalose transporter Tret1 [Blattella germanica]